MVETLGCLSLGITLMPAREPNSHPPLLDFIMQSSRRWQQFEFGCSLSPESDVLTGLLSLSPDDLCMLRELRIHIFYSTVNLYSQEVPQDLWHQSGLLTAQGLRSISIAGIHQPNMFRAGIPPNWKNLNHLFIHSPILLRLAHSILSCCCNLVACLLEIDEDNLGIFTFPGVSITQALSSCILLRLTFLSLQGDPTGCSRLFSSIERPSLRILDFQGTFPNESEEFGLLNFLQNTNSLETIRVDHRRLTESIVLKYFTFIPSVRHLVFGRSPKRSVCCTYSPFHHAYPVPGHVTFITTLHEIKHQYSPDSEPTVLFPLLESLKHMVF